jgi:cytochrome c oxidase subunit 2
MQPSSAFDPHSTLAQPIFSLSVQVFIMMGVILSIVAGLILYIMVRYRRREGAGEPVPNFGQRNLEIVWTILPIMLLVAIFVLTIRTMRASGPRPDKSSPDLVVTGYQWWWDVRYPKSGVIAANEIHLPVGTKMLVQLVGGDVIHDFWVPQLARKEDMVPGMQNQIWLEADEPGIYLGACSE